MLIKKPFKKGMGPSIAPYYKAAGGAFTPASLPNLLAWYKADANVYNDAGTTLATNSQTVQQWNDQSGNGYNISQATAGNRPVFLSAGLNSKQTVQFTAASTQFLWTAAGVIAMGTGNSASCFIVGQMTTNAANFARAVSYAATPAQADFNFAGNSAFIIRDGTNSSLSNYTNNVQGGIQAISLATTFHWGSIVDGGNNLISTYLNGGVASSTALTATAFVSPGQLGVGINVSGDTSINAGIWDGKISEIVITKDAMSSGNRTSLEAYFAGRW